MEFKIVIPTKGRAASQITTKYVQNVILCPSKKEAALYKELNPGVDIDAHPDTVIGLGAKRQWIYERFKNVFMMDDDLHGFSRMTTKQGESSKVSPELAYEIVQACGNLALMAGCHLFGFNHHMRPEHYSGHTPFTVSGVINGCGFGMIKDDGRLKFDTGFVLGHEFYISGLNAFHHRKAFFDKRYTINRGDFGNDVGGSANIRTLKSEKADTDRLVYYFGSAIKLKKDAGKKGKHLHSKDLIIPF